MFGLGALATSSLISGGASLLGGVLTNQSNANEASKNREFQEDMSNTSYQRAVADMKAAGLNPMLAASKGGASTPGGSMATMQNALGEAVSSANAARMMDAQIDQVEAGIAKTQAETDLTRAQIENMPTNLELTRAQTDSTRATASLTAAQERQVNATISEVVERTKGYASERARNNAIVYEIGERVKGYGLDRIQTMRATEEAILRADKIRQNLRADEPEAKYADETGTFRPKLDDALKANRGLQDAVGGFSGAFEAYSRDRARQSDDEFRRRPERTDQTTTRRGGTTRSTTTRRR